MQLKVKTIETARAPMHPGEVMVEISTVDGPVHAIVDRRSLERYN
jgi:hypothetical protein